MKGKNRRSGGIVQLDYLIHIEEIKPWPPSQSLRSCRSVLIQWENGERSSGSTNIASPSLGSIVGEGRIEFNESFRLPVALLRDMSVKNSDAVVFQRNCLEFNLYEPRRDKIVKGQLLATAIVDLADCGILRETLSISAPLNCKRSYRNTDQSFLFIKIEPVEKNRARPSLKDRLSKDNNGSDSVSALMNGEYAEEAEIASFTDDDVSSHSSLAAITTSPESSGCMPREHEENIPARNTRRNDMELPLASESRVEKMNMMQQDPYERLERSSSYVPSDVRSPVKVQASLTSTPNNGSATPDKQFVSPSADSSSQSLEEVSLSKSRSSDHGNLDQEVCGKVANDRNIVTAVHTNSDESAYSTNTASLDSNCIDPDSLNSAGSEINGKLNEGHEEADKYCVEDGASDRYYYNPVQDKLGNGMLHFDKQNHVEDESGAQGAKDQVLLSSVTNSFGGSDVGMKGNILKSEKLKYVKSVRSSADIARSISLGSNHHAEVKENGFNGDAQNSGGNIRSSDKREAKIYPREARNNILDSKVEHLESKIKMLEGELREAAAIEASLYSVVAEHGSSMGKVHAPARRLSRLYLHACKENIQARRSGAAKSAISGLVLVAKACGNDVPRLTFWLSNSIVLRTIISKTTKDVAPSNPAVSSTRRKSGEGNGKIAQSLIWKGYSHKKSENTAIEFGGIGNWDDPNVFTSALEKVEAWLFSRIVESIWWQSLTPHMQKSYTKMSGTCDQDLGNLSLDIWKNAFREACERICPLRAGRHECGCLSVLPRLIMEQCIARLDVAMFNAILRESVDDIPSDPISDPISDPKVLPIPPGKSSFGAGAQLKTAIGNWSRWLTDLFGIDDDDSLENRDDDELDNNDGRQNTSFKPFHLLNALSDLLMLPKDMLLSESIRKEVCPMFNASQIKKILDNFVPDEFCPDPIPTDVFEALDSKDDLEDGKDSVNNFPCIAAPIVYSPPPATTIASITGDIGTVMLRAFAGTNIAVTVTVGNGDIPKLAKLPAAQSWVASNILPFHPKTTINRIAVGNEILATSDKTLIAHTLPAMEALYKALQLANLTHIQVSTPHSLGILTSSEPPSSAAFRRGYDKTIFTPILNFLRQTNSPFMVNPYPFFGITSTRPDTLNYALFKPFHGVFDAATGVNYTNMFDAQMDAVFSAMKKVGYGDVELVVAETGWPSAGDPNQAGVGVDNAASYNGNLIKHVSSGKGTPLMPNRTFETFIFSLFNENLKATVSERNYGLFKPDLTPVYDVGLLTQQAAGPTSGPTAGPTAAPAEAPSSGSGEPPSSSKWCTAKQGASEAALQANIDFACSTKGVDCGPIKQGGPCFKPNTVRAHASFAMNAYYQASGRHDTDCDFGHTGVVTSINPSYETCTYVSSAEGPKQKVKNPDTVGSPTGSPVGSPKPAKSNDAGSLKAFLVHLQLICFCFFYL